MFLDNKRIPEEVRRTETREAHPISPAKEESKKTAETRSQAREDAVRAEVLKSEMAERVDDRQTRGLQRVAEQVAAVRDQEALPETTASQSREITKAREVDDPITRI